MREGATREGPRAQRDPPTDFRGTVKSCQTAAHACLDPLFGTRAHLSLLLLQGCLQGEEGIAALLHPLLESLIRPEEHLHPTQRERWTREGEGRGS